MDAGSMTGRKTPLPHIAGTAYRIRGYLGGQHDEYLIIIIQSTSSYTLKLIE